MADRIGNKRRYITGFDGLRAIAVIGVIIFHLWPNVMTGGWLGVPLFFVLSGYLITDILIQEFEKTGTIRFGSFYLRRVKRLYPALVVMLLATATAIAFFARPLLYNLRAILVTNLTYVYNLWATVNGDSYFEQWGSASPFTHLWSLSIEGQFYLVWPLIVWLLLKLKVPRVRVAQGLMGLALISALLMAIYYNPTNINRAYYGTDTRLFALLIGTALAFVWPSAKLNGRAKRQTRRLLDLAGFLAMAMLVFLFFTLNGEWAGTYYGVMFLASLDIAVIIGVTAHPATVFSHWLNNRLLNYIGTRSYSIYLYQLPVFVFIDIWTKHNHHLAIGLWKIVLVLILAELSYQFIEKVFKRYYGVDNIFNFDSVRIYTAFVMMMAVMATSGVLTPQASGPKPTTKLEQRLKQNKKLLAAQNAKALSAQQAGKKATSQTEETSSRSASTAKGAISIAGGATSAVARKYNLTDAQYQTVKSKTVTAIGDSVLLDAGPSLQELMPSTVVDGQVGRQPNEAVTLVQQMAAKGTLAQNLLMVIGTNGAISPAQVQTVMAAAGSQRQVYWVGVAADRAWISGNNSVLLAAQKKYANLHLIDWPDAAKEHPEWLGPDKVHPNVQGSIQYTSLIAQKIAEN